LWVECLYLVADSTTRVQVVQAVQNDQIVEDLLDGQLSTDPRSASSDYLNGLNFLNHLNRVTSHPAGVI